MNARRPSGFTLLEAIVAMAIFAVGVLALYQWQAVSLDAMRRVERSVARVEAGRDALEMLRAVNPMLEPRGRVALGDRTVAWVAEPLEPVRVGRSQAGYPSLFDVALYELDVTISDRAGEINRFKLRQVGFKQVRIARDDE